jgi:hypothetical protein
MRLVAITSTSKPIIAINATQRAIRARVTPCMARPPEPRRPPADEWFYPVHLPRQKRGGIEEMHRQINDDTEAVAKRGRGISASARRNTPCGSWAGAATRRRCVMLRSRNRSPTSDRWRFPSFGNLAPASWQPGLFHSKGREHPQIRACYFYPSSGAA